MRPIEPEEPGRAAGQGMNRFFNRQLRRVADVVGQQVHVLPRTTEQLQMGTAVVDIRNGVGVTESGQDRVFVFRIGRADHLRSEAIGEDPLSQGVRRAPTVAIAVLLERDADGSDAGFGNRQDQ